MSGLRGESGGGEVKKRLRGRPLAMRRRSMSRVRPVTAPSLGRILRMRSWRSLMSCTVRPELSSCAAISRGRPQKESVAAS